MAFMTITIELSALNKIWLLTIFAKEYIKLSDVLFSKIVSFMYFCTFLVSLSTRFFLKRRLLNLEKKKFFTFYSNAISLRLKAIFKA